MILIITIIAIILIVCYLQIIEPYYDPVSCVVMYRRMRNAVSRGELTNLQADLLWIIKKYDLACGSRNFDNNY